KIRVDDNLGTTQKMPPDVYKAVIGQAHKRNLRVAVHLFYREDAKGVLDAGADFIAHSVRDRDVDDALIAMLKRRNVCYCPTLTRELSTFVYESTPEWFGDPLFTKYADPRTIELLKEPARQERMRNSRSAQRYKAALEQASRNLKRLADAGVTIARAGLTPRQVLLAATRDAARCHKVDADLGTLEPNKWADFVVLDADPLADIANVRKI